MFVSASSLALLEQHTSQPRGPEKILACGVGGDKEENIHIEKLQLRDLLSKLFQPSVSLPVRMEEPALVRGGATVQWGEMASVAKAVRVLIILRNQLCCQRLGSVEAFGFRVYEHVFGSELANTNISRLV